MEFHFQIKTKAGVIAQFAHEGDRDVCIDALRGFYPDSEFFTAESGAPAKRSKKTREDCLRAKCVKGVRAG